MKEILHDFRTEEACRVNGIIEHAGHKYIVISIREAFVIGSHIRAYVTVSPVRYD